MIKDQEISARESGRADTIEVFFDSEVSDALLVGTTSCWDLLAWVGDVTSDKLSCSFGLVAAIVNSIPGSGDGQAAIFREVFRWETCEGEF